MDVTASTRGALPADDRTCRGCPRCASLGSDSPIYVAGHRGLAGSAVWRAFAARGRTDLIGASSAELDLRDRTATFDYLLATIRPDVVVLAAARVGGIRERHLPG